MALPAPGVLGDEETGNDLQRFARLRKGNRIHLRAREFANARRLVRRLWLRQRRGLVRYRLRGRNDGRSGRRPDRWASRWRGSLRDSRLATDFDRRQSFLRKCCGRTKRHNQRASRSATPKFQFLHFGIPFRRQVGCVEVFAMPKERERKLLRFHGGANPRGVAADIIAVTTLVRKSRVELGRGSRDPSSANGDRRRSLRLRCVCDFAKRAPLARAAPKADRTRRRPTDRSRSTTRRPVYPGRARCGLGPHAFECSPRNERRLPQETRLRARISASPEPQ